MDGDYVIAYKSTQFDGFSVFNPLYQYKIGEIYESNCDCNVDHEISHGLSAWTKEEALKFYSSGELYKVRIHIDDVGMLVPKNNKIRCFKLEILEKVGK